MITKQEMGDKLYYSTMCEAQHGGFPCNSCFHTIIEEDYGDKLKEDIHKYWEAVLDFRGDYDDYDWPRETDTSKFYELIEELYNTINSDNLKTKLNK